MTTGKPKEHHRTSRKQNQAIRGLIEVTTITLWHGIKTTTSLNG